MPSGSPASQLGHEEGLRHQLTAGQMAMVAVGGSIGTGLLLGSGAAMGIAGPAAILSFVAAAFIAWTVVMALGELACAHPAAGSIGIYGDLYLNPLAGFMARAGYWLGLAISVGAEMVAAATYMSFWFPHVAPFVWIIAFSVVLLFVNLRSVGSYGRFEFWFAMIKLATIAIFIVGGAALLFSGKVTPQYQAHGGFLPNGPLSPLLAITVAIYSFGGIEMVAVTTGESRTPSEIPRAVRLTFLILMAVYVGAIVVLLGVMPWNRAGVTESPFVSVFRILHLPAASHVMNFVVLTAALSGSNAALYICSRMLFSLARTGWAPARLGRLNASGSPQLAVLVSCVGMVLALVLVTFIPGSAFLYILGAAFTGLMLSWLIPLAAHVNFRRRHSPEEIAHMPLRSPLGKWGSIVGFVLVAASLVQTWLVPRVNLWSGMACLAALTVAYALLKPHRTAQPKN